MKNAVLLFVIALMGISAISAQPHFVPQWWIDPPPNGQNPYTAHNVLISGAKINGVDLEPGDEIGIFDTTLGDFDTSLLVGAVTITAADLPLSIDTPIGVICSTEGGEVPGSAEIGDMVILKFWDASAGLEYSYPIMSVQFNEPPSWWEDPYSGYLFEGGGTTYVVTSEYWDPVASDTEIFTAPAGPFGGSVIETFEGTGVSVNVWLLSGVTGDMTVHAFDELSTDQYYEVVGEDTSYPVLNLGGTVPVEDFTNYGWYIDPGILEFYIATGITNELTFALNEVLPEGYTMDTETVGIYRRDIHGTAYYYEVPSVYDPVTNTITITITSNDLFPGEFILTGILEEPPLPVELTSFTAMMSNTLGAVNLTWVTQSEENLAGFRVYRGNNDVLAEAADQNTLIPATNTSQTAMYQFSDPEIQAGQIYYYWLEAQEMNGVGQYYGPVSITTPTDASNAPQIPLETGLAALYPNPFNPDLTIRYGLQTPAQTEIYITNTKGQLVKTIHSGHREAGFYTYLWDGRDNLGRQCSSGLYLIRMQAGKQSFTRKAILAK